ncbi:MAG TPA: adenylate/guanylate cyclase domain-containing protein [Stellaceae bacterium]|nr:adenylate/guanylate cyclase domain-containing protein [Stellaceae bacterium]
MTRRDVAAVAGIALVAALLLASSLFARLEGPGIDVLFWLRQRILGSPQSPADSPVVVIGIDEETYRRPPFADTPRVMWTPQAAKILNAVLDAGATVVGFDSVYATSIEPFIPGYERDFLRSLHRAGSERRLVLGYMQHQQQPIVPFRGHILAAGTDTLRGLNLLEDPDGVIRRVPLFLHPDGQSGGMPQPAFALALAARARGVAAERRDDGTVLLGGEPVRQMGANALGLNFDTEAGAVPTYSFADLAACAEQGNADYFRRNFSGRVVLIGTVLDVEDRILSSDRFATWPEGMNLPARCVVPPMEGLFRADLRRDTIPGVYVHAAAITTLLRGDGLVPVPRWVTVLALFALAGLVGLAVMRHRQSLAAALSLFLAVAWACAALVAFDHDLVLPLFKGGIAALLGFGGALAYRFGVTDRNRRRLARAFTLYLPGPVVDRLVATDAQPQLGGELRIVSILFSDLAGFTRVSEHLDPQALVSALNTYFAGVTQIIEAHGGFVDKFIGDAVVGVFGAPLDDPRHAENAVKAALAIRATGGAAARALAPPGGAPPQTRIGINTGPVLIGNIGSPRRFNYTVMGDAVNLASRVEGVNKRYGTLVLVSDATMAACGAAVVFREIDTVTVQGRARAVGLYEPLGAAGSVPAETLARRDAFAAALRLWRVGAFAEAARQFGALAEADEAARRLAAHAEEYVIDPPADWSGVSVLTEK